MPTRILIAEDDPSIGFGLRESLLAEGYEVELSERGDEVLGKVSDFSPHLLVLDIMMPGMSGYDVCRELRKTDANTPVLMLTAKGQETDKVIGLELGADDYVTKPFGLAELNARIRALLRRAPAERPPAEEAAADAPAPATFKAAGCAIDPARFELTDPEGKSHSLTEKELGVLTRLVSQPGIVWTRDRLLEEVWGYNYYGTTRTLDQLIVGLRKKLAEPPGSPAHLLTVHGIGYKFV